LKTASPHWKRRLSPLWQALCKSISQQMQHRSLSGSDQLSPVISDSIKRKLRAFSNTPLSESSRTIAISQIMQSLSGTQRARVLSSVQSTSRAGISTVGAVNSSPFSESIASFQQRSPNSDTLTFTPAQEMTPIWAFRPFVSTLSQQTPFREISPCNTARRRARTQTTNITSSPLHQYPSIQLQHTSSNTSPSLLQRQEGTRRMLTRAAAARSKTKPTRYGTIVTKYLTNTLLQTLHPISQYVLSLLCFVRSFRLSHVTTSTTGRGIGYSIETHTTHMSCFIVCQTLLR